MRVFSILILLWVGSVFASTSTYIRGRVHQSYESPFECDMSLAVVGDPKVARLRQIRANPKSVELRLAYAEYIEGMDPNAGEFIRVQEKLADPAFAEERSALEKQQTALLERSVGFWVTKSSAKVGYYWFRRGFVEAIVIHQVTLPPASCPCIFEKLHSTFDRLLRRLPALRTVVFRSGSEYSVYGRVGDEVLVNPDVNAYHYFGGFRITGRITMEYGFRHSSLTVIPEVRFKLKVQTLRQHIRVSMFRITKVERRNRIETIEEELPVIAGLFDREHNLKQVGGGSKVYLPAEFDKRCIKDGNCYIRVIGGVVPGERVYTVR